MLGSAPRAGQASRPIRPTAQAPPASPVFSRPIRCAWWSWSASIKKLT